MKMRADIIVIGAGAWGGTLGHLLAANGHRVALWEPFTENYKNVKKSGFIIARGPVTYRIPISSGMKVFDSPERAFDMVLKGAGDKVIMYAVPSHSVREISKTVKSLVKKNENYIFLSVVKGIDTATMKTMSEVICAEIPSARKNFSVLSGPSFAVEVVRQNPTAVVAASRNHLAAKLIQKLFTTGYFRVYTSGDVKGVELGGSLKNVFAVACGISDGLRLGDNSKAALITRGMREMVKLGVCLGGKLETFTGLSGLGDLMMTCFSGNSRNRLFGEMVAKGKSPGSALKKMGAAVEGYRTTLPAYNIGRKAGIDLPIINETYRILYEGKNPGKAVRDLMARASKEENQ